MTRVFEAVLVGVMIVAAAPAAAQTPAGAAAPIVNMGYIGINTGGAVVEKFGSVFGLEAGVRVWKNLDIVGEVAWMTDVVTRRQLDRAETIATFLATTQNAPTSGSLKVPAFYGGGGLRWVFESGSRFRPYLIATFGAAQTELKPTFRLNGADVTSSMTQYGITLGQDVLGKYSNPAASGGIGILLKVRDTFYLDGGVRMISISDEGQRVNVARIVAGGGYRF